MSEPIDNQKNLATSGEPMANRQPVSILMIGLFALMVYWAMAHLDADGGGFDKQVYWPYRSADELADVQPPIGPNPGQGKILFGKYCSVCHQATGLGLPGQFPPLAGSDWVNEKDPIRVINLVMNGLQGTVKVSGQEFNNSGMLAWKTVVLKDDEMASILTFIRGNKEWGNTAGPVTTEEVAAVRGKTASRSSPYTVDELLKIPLGAPK